MLCDCTLGCTDTVRESALKVAYLPVPRWLSDKHICSSVKTITVYIPNPMVSFERDRSFNCNNDNNHQHVCAASGREPMDNYIHTLPPKSLMKFDSTGQNTCKPDTRFPSTRICIYQIPTIQGSEPQTNLRTELLSNEKSP